MKEYAYPSGLEIRDDSLWPLHLGLAALVIASVLILVRQTRRPALWWDVPLWVVAFVAEWCLAQWIFGNLVTSESIFPMYFVGLLLINVAALLITVRHKYGSGTVNVLFSASVIVGVAIAFLLPAVQQAKEAARRTQCKNNLKQIGLAIRNYTDTYGQFPYAGKVVSDSEQVCSWRVAVLPYLEAVRFRDVYHLEEPWNSPFNLKVLDVYGGHSRYGPWHCPTVDRLHRFTDYSMLTGPGTIGGDGVTVLKPDDVTDGTSTTIFIVEACGTEILFTEPKDVEVTEASLGVNLPGEKPGLSRAIISSKHIGGAHIVLGDGTVRFVNEKIDRTVLKGLTTIAGGESVTP